MKIVSEDTSHFKLTARNEETHRQLLTADNITSTNLQNISNFLTENNNNFDEFIINTNQFDLLTEEILKTNEILLTKDTCGNLDTLPREGFEFDDVIDDCWSNIAKYFLI